MSKEKEIDEISDIIDDTVCIDYRRSRYDCLIGSKTAAKCIIEAGYRKADEVRKETAKEILDKLLTIMPNGYEQLKAFVKVREEEYGVEVDE